MALMIPMAMMALMALMALMTLMAPMAMMALMALMVLFGAAQEPHNPMMDEKMGVAQVGCVLSWV